MIILLAHKNKQGNGAGMLHKTMLEVNNKSLGGRGGGAHLFGTCTNFSEMLVFRKVLRTYM